MKLVPHEQIQMLGVPLGDDGFVSGFVEGKLLDRLQDTVNKLAEIEDTGSHLFVASEFQHSSCSSFHADDTTCPVESASCEVRRDDSQCY